MVAPRYSGSGIRSARRGLSIVECVFAVSVMVGLMFVTIRLMSMGLPAVLLHTTQSDTTELKTETPQSVPETADSKTP